MDQTFRPLLDALKQIGIDPVAVDAAADEAVPDLLRPFLIDSSVDGPAQAERNV